MRPPGELVAFPQCRSGSEGTQTPRFDFGINYYISCVRRGPCRTRYRLSGLLNAESRAVGARRLLGRGILLAASAAHGKFEIQGMRADAQDHSDAADRNDPPPNFMAQNQEWNSTTVNRKAGPAERRAQPPRSRRPKLPVRVLAADHCPLSGDFCRGEVNNLGVLALPAPGAARGAAVE